MPDFLPQSQSALFYWLESFTGRIVADPEAWDVKPSDAAELSVRYALYAAA